METFRLYLITWNVATRPPEEDVTAMLGLGVQSGNCNLPDIYVIGLQEVKSQPQNMLMDALLGNPWTNAFREPLSRCGYIVARTIRLQGIVLSIFVLREHLLRIRDIETIYTKTGFGGMWGNKGAVSVRFSVSGVSVCLVNCHLTPHDHLLADRISDYNTILDDQVFSNQETANIFFHDYVFWIGDLNFRLKEEAGTTADILRRLETKVKTKSGSVADGSKKLFDKDSVDSDSRDVDIESIKMLLEDDQLRLVMTSGAAFSELREEPVTFPPTYKFLFNSSEYDVKRRPSWTDRILYRVNENAYENITLGAKQISYRSHPQYLQSDHKPVSAQFEIKVLCDYEDRLVHFHPVGTWFLDEENFASFALADDVKPSCWDWIGVFKEGFVSIEDYVSYVYVPKLDESFKTSATEVAEEAAVEASALAFGSVKNEDTVMESCKSGANPKNLQAWMRVSFPDTSLQSPGTYQLLYLTQTSSSVLGISAPFKVERRGNRLPFVGQDVGIQRPLHYGGASSAPSTPSRTTLD